MKHYPHTLPLFTSEAAAVIIPRYGIRFVRESQIIYTKGINEAEMVVSLCQTIHPLMTHIRELQRPL